MSTHLPSSSWWSLPSNGSRAPATSLSTSSSGGDVGSARFGSWTSVSFELLLDLGDLGLHRLRRARRRRPSRRSRRSRPRPPSSPRRSARRRASATRARPRSPAAARAGARRARSPRRAERCRPCGARGRRGRGRGPRGSALRSSMTAGGPLLACWPAYLLTNVRDVLGVLPHDDVRGHDRAREAAVADREQDVVVLLGADVEVRSVRALVVLLLLGRRRAEGVTPRASVWQPLQRSWKSWAPLLTAALPLSALFSLTSCCPQADTPAASAAARRSVAIFRVLGMRRRILSGTRCGTSSHASWPLALPLSVSGLWRLEEGEGRRRSRSPRARPSPSRAREYKFDPQQRRRDRRRRRDQVRLQERRVDRATT